MMHSFHDATANRSRGAALISALLTVALATLLATQLIVAQSDAMQNMSGRHDLAQARWLARSAADWARAILAADARNSRIDHLGESWAIKVPPLPIRSGQSQDILEGEVSGEIADQDGRFNLNRLAPGGKADQEQIDIFVRLLVFLGTPENEARRLALAVADWIDSDAQTVDGAAELLAYGVPFDNQPLLGVGTLLRIPGFTPRLLTRLQPYVSALPRRVPLNLNTAAAEVLAAELPELGLAAAQRVVAERVRTPFRDIADFNARFEGAGANAACGVSSNYFIATTRASFGESVVMLRTLLYRTAGNAWPDILWQQIL